MSFTLQINELWNILSFFSLNWMKKFKKEMKYSLMSMTETRNAQPVGIPYLT